MATPSATRMAKVELSAVTEIPTSTKMAVFGDPDGNGVRLLGYMDMGSGFVPLSGTEVDKPITGDLEFKSEDFAITRLFSGPDADGYTTSLDFDNDSPFIQLQSYNSVDGLQAIVRLAGDSVVITSSNSEGVLINLDNPDSKGIVGNSFFNKQNDRLAFAQLGDIGAVNNTATALSLATLNVDYATQGVGFKVICPTINIIYIKSSLTTWEQFSTTTVV